nr:GTPase HflX [Pseudooceanicola batsensis]
MPRDRPDTRAWVLHPDLLGEDRRHAAEFALEEAVSLARALPGLEVVGSSIVRLANPTPATLFGSGKVAELSAFFADNKVELVLVDGPVTPVQQRNLEKAWGGKLLDRTGLILEIFSDRARTREGVLQVEMAALAYQRTRLVRAWTHLERQRGGLGFVGGPGETQIEADRRAIDEQLTRLRRQLEKVVRTRELHRAARARVPFPIVALVGYTNAGKSTLFNRLTGAEVLAKDMLFATLDPTMRRVRLPNNGPEVILSDTVGFISDLPTQLVAAFRATLEEVLEADLILHIRDISHPEAEEQKADVEDILSDLGLPEEVPVLEVWNKVDRLPPEDAGALARRAERDGTFVISAVTGAGLDPLLDAVERTLDQGSVTEELTLGFDEGRRRAWLYEQGLVVEETQGEEGHRITVRWSPRQSARFRSL